MSGEYTKRDIAKMLGKPLRTIQHWAAFGISFPRLEDVAYRGGNWLYDDLNVIEFQMVDILNKRCGMPLGMIANILSSIRSAEDKAGSAYRTFFADPGWGVSKELLFVGDVFGFGDKRYEVIKKDSNGRWLFPDAFFGAFMSSQISPSFVVLALGKIKIEAAKVLDV